MTIDSHTLSIFFAVCSLLSGCTQTNDGGQVHRPTEAYIQDRKVAGWTMMSAQERNELRQKMLSMKSYAECADYIENQYQMMHERAQENGSSRPTNRTDICQRMKSAGIFR